MSYFDIFCYSIKAPFKALSAFIEKSKRGSQSRENFELIGFYRVLYMKLLNEF